MLGTSRRSVAGPHPIPDPSVPLAASGEPTSHKSSPVAGHDVPDI